jgi:ribonuclease VapC
MSDIAVDTSAIVEVLVEGPRAVAIRETLGAADIVFVTSVARIEVALVMMGRFGWDRATFDRAWLGLGVEEVAVDCRLARSQSMPMNLGKGRAKAGLNFGDCFSYALAIARNVPLLFVGEDFAQTDIGRA